MGKGFMQGTQTHLEFIPERTTDFVFAAFSEEQGLVGCLVLITGFLALIYRGDMIALGTPAQLKRETADGIIAVTGDQPQLLLAAVEDLPGVREAALFGRGIHVVTADAAALLPAVQVRLAERGFAAAAAVVEPSLEDVFVMRIEAHDRNGAAA